MSTVIANAVAGVGARNGADQDGLGNQTKRQTTAARPALASHFVVLVDRCGFVGGVFAGQTAARSFLQEGAA